jgi:hypothetical protein
VGCYGTITESDDSLPFTLKAQKPKAQKIYFKSLIFALIFAQEGAKFLKGLCANMPAPKYLFQKTATIFRGGFSLKILNLHFGQ